MPKSPEHLEAALGLLLAAWLCWRVIRGLARVAIVCALGLLLTGILGCGVPGEAGSTAGSRFDGGRSGTLTRVVEGDTVHVQIAGDDVTLRILGVSAPPELQRTPETKKRRDCGGEEATALMTRLAPPGTKVTVTTDSTTGTRSTRSGARSDSPMSAAATSASRSSARAARPSTATAAGAVRAWARYEAAERDAPAARRGSWAACPGFHSRR